MINIRECFQTEVAAKAWRESTLRAYHPAGYGTALSVSKTPDGYWIVSGYRYSSCD